MMTRFFRTVCFVTTGLLFGCSHDEMLVIHGTSELLEAPYPMNYPSSAPKPNRVLRVVSDQEVRVLDERVEKDYLVYRVRIGSGEEGFIIAQPNVHKKRENER